jgi:hypothetical protein
MGKGYNIPRKKKKYTKTNKVKRNVTKEIENKVKETSINHHHFHYAGGKAALRAA